MGFFDAFSSSSENVSTTQTTTQNYVDSFNTTQSRVNTQSNAGNFYLAVGDGSSLKGLTDSLSGGSGTTGAAAADPAADWKKYALWAGLAILAVFAIKKWKGG